MFSDNSNRNNDLKQQNAAEPEGFREEAIWEQLRTVYDPEIPVNIADLGLIYSAQSVASEGGRRIDVRMSLTAPGCGMSEVIKAQVERKLAALPGVSAVTVDVVFDPPWNPGMMSEAAKLQLGLDAEFGRSTQGSLPFNVIR